MSLLKPGKHLRPNTGYFRHLYLSEAYRFPFSLKIEPH